MNKVLARTCASIPHLCASFKTWLHKAFFSGPFYFLLLLCPLSANVIHAEERSLPLTAAYIYYFTKFVVWPNNPEIKRICIASDNPALKTEFEKIAQKSSATIEVFFDVTGHFKSTENILSPVADDGRDSTDSPLRYCQLIYLTAAFEAKSYPLLSAHGTLLVVDQNMAFPEASIHLVLENNKLGFDINRRNAKLQGLDISAKLLGLAREVKD